MAPRIFKGLLLAAAVLAVAGTAGGALWQSYQTSRREAAVFASLSATAFEQGFCDRALRLAMAGLPPATGGLGFSFRSPQLLGELAFFASSHDCYFQAALAGHTHLVSSAVFSPDGARVLTTSWDGTARVWDAATGAGLVSLAGHAGWINNAAFSPDGARIVTASWDKTARVWDAKTGAALATLSGHTGPVGNAAFSPDGSRIVTASNDDTARIWNAKTGALLATLSGHTELGEQRCLQSGRRARLDRVVRRHGAAVGRAERCRTREIVRSRRLGMERAVQSRRIAHRHRVGRQ